MNPVLLTLHIQDFALIDSLELSFGPGLTILTGETGAGKSIILDAVSLAVGGRITVDAVRTGREKAVISALFRADEVQVQTFAEWGVEPEEDGTLLLTREITAQGRSTCRINGRVTTVSVLREIGSRLIDIHGQHDLMSLFKVDNHRLFLDGFAGDSILPLRQRVEESYHRLKQLEKLLSQLKGDEKERLRRLDLLEFQLKEIDEARLKEGEEEALAEELTVMGAAERILTSCSRAYELLYGTGRQKGAMDVLGQAVQEIAGLLRFDPRLTSLRDALQGIVYQLDDVCRELADYRERIEWNPARLAELEKRSDLIYNLKRKYGDSISEILRFRAEAAAEVEFIKHSEEEFQRISREIGQVKQELAAHAAELSRKRWETAKILEERVSRELKDLMMPHARFAVEFTRQEDSNGIEMDGRRVAVAAHGADQIEFLLSANPGEPLRPLSKIASGGEASRILLAIKAILGKADGVATQIFDEIDAGVGGRAAQAVAEKVGRMSRGKQILCVTHLPQMAAFADHHFAVRKEVQGDRTAVKAYKLSPAERQEEIARMLGGAEVTELTRQHAREMIDLAERQKNKLGPEEK